MRALVLAAALATALIAHPALAQGGKNQVDQRAVDRALWSLNAVRTLYARFEQMDQRGNRWTGQMWLHRPGRLRFEYDAPEEDVIWTTGTIVKHYDAALETVSHIPAGLTPAWFLLEDPVRIDKDVEVLATDAVGKRYFVTASQESLLAKARVTIGFELGDGSQPDRILGWTVTEGDGTSTQVELTEMVMGAPIEKSIFRYRPPIPDYREN